MEADKTRDQEAGESGGAPEGYYNVAIFSDDSSLVIQFASAFQESAYRLLLARSREELLSAAVCERVDLVLIDEQMASIDTWNIARVARQHVVGEREVAFIGFVTSLNAQLMLKGRELGIDAFLLKTQSGSDLAERVNFIARRVERRTGSDPDSPFRGHMEFLQGLREQIEIVQAPRPASSSAQTKHASKTGSSTDLKRGDSNRGSSGSSSGRSTSGRGGTSSGRPASSSSPVTRFKRTTQGTDRAAATDRKSLDLTGRTFGKVRIEKEIGRGGGGVVYTGHHTSLDMKVAVKVLYPDLAERDPEFARQFLTEARVAARISDGSVVRVFDCDRDDASGCYYIIMEFVEGSDLQDEIKRSGALSEDRILDIALETSRCLMAAEELGIIHRDIKPANILLTGTQVKVADLGLAKHVESHGLGSGRLTKSTRMRKGPLVGTPYYMSPEQIENSADIDSRTDIYSLGATLYHAATGNVPFTGEDMGEILFHHLHTEPPLISDRNESITAEFARLVQKMMSKRPRQRYSSLRETYGVFREHRDFLVIRRAREEDESKDKSKSGRTGIFFRQR